MATSNDLQKSASMPFIHNDKVGAMYKLGANTRTWKLRYFFLDVKRRTLFYFVDEESCNKFRGGQTDVFKGKIELHSATLYPYANYCERPNAFELTTPREPFFFSAKPAEVQDWVASLAYSCKLTLVTPDSEVYVQGSVIDKVRRGKHGYMNKRGRVNKDYQPRFFRTTEDASGRRVLAYYKTPYDTKPQGEAFVIDELKIFNGDLEVNPKLAPMVIGSLSSEDEKDKSPSASSSSSSSPSTPPRSSRPSSPTGDGETGTAGSGEGDVSPGLAVSTVFRPSFKTSSNFAPSMFYDPKVGLASTEFTVQSLGRSLCLRAAAARDKREWIEVLHAISRGNDRPVVVDLYERQDLYAIVGVPSDASPEAISSEYQRRLADPELTNAKARSLLRMAYDILMHPKKRPIYDEMRINGHISAQASSSSSSSSPSTASPAAAASGGASPSATGKGDSAKPGVGADADKSVSFFASSRRPTLHLPQYAGGGFGGPEVAISPIAAVAAAVDRALLLHERAEAAEGATSATTTTTASGGVGGAGQRGGYVRESNVGDGSDDESDAYKEEDNEDEVVTAVEEKKLSSPLTVTPPSPLPANAAKGGPATPTAATGSPLPASPSASPVIPSSTSSVSPAPPKAASVPESTLANSASPKATGSGDGQGAAAFKTDATNISKGIGQDNGKESKDNTAGPVKPQPASVPPPPTPTTVTGEVKQQLEQLQNNPTAAVTDAKSAMRAWPPAVAEVAQVLMEGVKAYKVPTGMFGDAKLVKFNLLYLPPAGAIPGTWAVQWESKKKASEEALIRLVPGQTVFKPGQDYGAFKAHKKYCSQFVAGVCFSILAEDPDKKDSKSSSAKGRDSVDIACVDAVAYAAWSQVLIKILGSGKVVPAGGR